VFLLPFPSIHTLLPPLQMGEFFFESFPEGDMMGAAIYLAVLRL